LLTNSSTDLIFVRISTKSRLELSSVFEYGVASYDTPQSQGPKLASKAPTYRRYYIHGPREPCSILVIRSSIWPLGTLRRPDGDDLVHIPQQAETRFSRKLGKKGGVVERIVNRGAKRNHIMESVNRGKKPAGSCYHVLLLRGRAIRHSRSFLS
jgi:hypothetical protein